MTATGNEAVTLSQLKSVVGGSGGGTVSGVFVASGYANKQFQLPNGVTMTTLQPCTVVVGYTEDQIVLMRYSTHAMPQNSTFVTFTAPSGTAFSEVEANPMFIATRGDSPFAGNVLKEQGGTTYGYKFSSSMEGNGVILGAILKFAEGGGVIG